MLNYITMASLEREIEILEYKIAKLEEQIQIFEDQNISDRKKEKLIEKKAIYEQQLADRQP
jgi:hypothetical protein